MRGDIHMRNHRCLIHGGLALLGGVLLVLTASAAQARLVVDPDGDLRFEPAGRVLSSGSDGGGGGDGGSFGSSGGSSGSSDSSGSGSLGEERDEARDARGTGKAEVEEDDEDAAEAATAGPARPRTEVRIREGGEIRTEVRLESGARIRTRVEPEKGRTRTEITQGGVKVRLEREGDRFRVKAETETGEEEDLGQEDIVIVDERAGRGRIQLRTARDHTIIDRNAVQAVSNFPLSIDLATNTLTVTTPAGESPVTVLPDQAVQNLLAANVVDRIGGTELVRLVQESGITSVGQVVSLSLANGVPVYEIPGVKEHRLLGFLPVTTTVTAVVSAETGEVVGRRQSFVDRLIDLLSVGV